MSIFDQLRRPAGARGEALAQLMNRRHSDLTDWGIERLTIAPTDVMLDIGCGGGATIHKLAARATQGRVCGIDYSDASVSVARSTNAEGIASGRVAIELGSVASLPYPDRTFAVATAVETHYYWPDLVANLREVRRVLAPGGTLVLVAEAYRRGRLPTPTSIVMTWLLRAHYLSASEHEALLSEAGFTDVSVDENRPKGWLRALGRRPRALRV